MLTKEQLERICVDTGVHMVLAGGALRDEYLGRAQDIKDYDIFFYDKRDNIARVVRTYLSGFLTPPEEPYGNVSECVWQAEVQVPGVDRLVNFVAIAVPPSSRGLARDVVHRCDFGICQIAWDGVRDYITAAFHKDLDNKTFTLRPDILEPNKLERSQRRWDRFKERYPDFTVVYTPEQQEILCSM